MLPDYIRDQVLDAIYSEEELYGCVVGLYANNQCIVLSAGYTPSINYGRILVIVEQLDLPGNSPGLGNITRRSVALSDLPGYISNRSRVTRELIGASLSCGFAVVAGLAAVGSAAAEVPTLGGSTVLLLLAWTGFVTASFQCGNGIARGMEALRYPDSNSIQIVDDDESYQRAFFWVDAIGVGTGLAALPAAAKNAWAVLQRRGSLMSLEAIGRLSRAERKAAILAALKQATRTEDGFKEVSKALLAAGLKERQAAQVMEYGASSVRRSMTTLQAISKTTTARLHLNLLAAVSGGVTPFVSGMPASLVGSASGSVNALIVHVMNQDNS